MNDKQLSGKELLDTFLPYFTNNELVELALSLKVSGAIIRRRVQLGMSQADLANRLGVKQPVVSKWESGDVNYTIKTIVDIFGALDLDFEILIGDEAEKYRKHNTHENVWKYEQSESNKSSVELLAKGA